MIFCNYKTILISMYSTKLHCKIIITCINIITVLKRQIGNVKPDKVSESAWFSNFVIDLAIL